MAVVACPGCSEAVALHAGRPFVSSTGAVVLWHPTCWGQPVRRGVEEVTVVLPEAQRTSAKLSWIAGGALALLGVAIGSYLWRDDHAPASLATFSANDAEPFQARAFETAREAAPPLPDDTARYPVPVVDGTPLDELYPSLLDWTHPVTGSETKLPPQATGRFGAERVGIMRSECGAGHCGVDLGGPRGRPIVAVTDGIVVRVERSELGRDGRSGRYVRIEHDDGTLTAYMHLDAIVEGLQVGDRVDGGQQIGTLGATAIFVAAPHLHFSLEVPRVPGTHGDHTNTRYVDPAPFLTRANVHGAADRRHADKPAW